MPVDCEVLRHFFIVFLWWMELICYICSTAYDKTIKYLWNLR